METKEVNQNKITLFKKKIQLDGKVLKIHLRDVEMKISQSFTLLKISNINEEDLFHLEKIHAHICRLMKKPPKEIRFIVGDAIVGKCQFATRFWEFYQYSPAPLFPLASYRKIRRMKPFPKDVMFGNVILILKEVNETKFGANYIYSITCCADEALCKKDVHSHDFEEVEKAYQASWEKRVDLKQC